LAKVVTNLCLNRLTSARAVREDYVGLWLPEPMLTADSRLGPMETVEQWEPILSGWMSRPLPGLEIAVAEVNGQPGILGVAGGRLLVVFISAQLSRLQV
jgi:hypothetical protein